MSEMTAPPVPCRYQLPTHLDVPDKITFSLLGFSVGVTLRQGVILLLGGSSAFRLWKQTALLSGSFALLEHAVVPSLLLLLTLLWSVLSIRERSLEEWLAILLYAAMSPRLSLWRPLDEEEGEVPDPQQTRDRSAWSEVYDDDDNEHD